MEPGGFYVDLVGMSVQGFPAMDFPGLCFASLSRDFLTIEKSGFLWDLIGMTVHGFPGNGER